MKIQVLAKDGQELGVGLRVEGVQRFAFSVRRSEFGVQSFGAGLVMQSPGPSNAYKGPETDYQYLKVNSEH